MSENLFITASRLQLRFPSVQGNLSVEQLWELPLKTDRANRASLNDIAMDLYKQVKETSDIVSFVDDTKPADPKAKLSLDIVKYIIDVKKAENKAAADARARSEEAQQIMAIIAQKKAEALSNADLADLEARLAVLTGKTPDPAATTAAVTA